MSPEGSCIDACKAFITLKINYKFNCRACKCCLEISRQLWYLFKAISTRNLKLLKEITILEHDKTRKHEFGLYQKVWYAFIKMYWYTFYVFAIYAFSRILLQAQIP